MNWRLVLYILASLALVNAGAMLPSLGLAFFYEETPVVSQRMVGVFAGVIAFSVFLGLFVRHLTRRQQQERVTPAEGFAVAALGWIFVAALGALPYYFARNGLPGMVEGIGTSPGINFGFVEAFFESMSGYTTTGSSIFGTALADGGYGTIESLPRSILFWRSMTHWLGGMGIVVLVLAILPALRAGGYQMFAAEVPGPTAERLQPRIRETAAILWGVYLLLTVAETLLLWAGSMPLFDSICHTFGTMATGGFSTKDLSIGHYAQAGDPMALYFEIVISIFMFLAGCNFLLHYKALHGRLRAYNQNLEFRLYFFLLAGAIAFFTFSTWATIYPSWTMALRQSVFQTLSITTTTGFATADFDLWPGASRLLFIILMFCGGCAGSTGGGVKQMRLLVVGKVVMRELIRLLRPRYMNRIHVGSASLEERTCANIVGLVLLWLGVFTVAGFLVMLCLPDSGSANGDLVTGFSSVAATLNNIGPGLDMVGATQNYHWLPASAKVILTFCMLLGRLEVYSVIVVLMPLAWRR